MPVETSTMNETGHVKYHLVEAEEVAAEESVAKAPMKMKKGKVQWTQLPLTPAKPMDGSMPNGKKSHHHKGHRGRRWKNNGKRFNGQQQTGYYNNYQQPPPADPQVTAEWAKNQIEYYFSPDNLVRDTFLRRNMDVDGYVPVGFVAGFQAVYNVHQDYASLFEALKHSQVLEMDVENEKIRTREGWQKWLWPNANGGYGVPRYIKMVHQEEEQGVETDQESNN